MTSPDYLTPQSPARSLRALREAALNLADEKATEPLEPISLDQAYTEAILSAQAVKAAMDSYNAAVELANLAINTKKAASQAADLTATEAALRLLEATKARHEAPATAACEAYDQAVRTKGAKEADKAAARSRLDAYTERVIGRYEKTINRLLDDFQAGFRLTGTRHLYPGGVPSSSFQILINETAVELGDAGTPLSSPSFRNTLSSGDKSTLALAFFLAQLEHDPDKSRQSVVFDDPFSSQDAFRRDHTVEKIRKCGDDCAQVTVLSHDQFFLKRIWERLAPDRYRAERKTLQMSRIGLRNTAISEWDIERATQHRLAADRKTLTDFYNAGDGDPRDVVSKLRPVLEAHCRNVSTEFLETDMLPTIVTKVRQSGATHVFADVVDDMESINLYTRRYHHGEGAQPATEVINDTELQGFVKKTLEIAGGC